MKKIILFLQRILLVHWVETKQAFVKHLKISIMHTPKNIAESTDYIVTMWNKEY